MTELGRTFVSVRGCLSVVSGWESVFFSAICCARREVFLSVLLHKVRGRMCLSVLHGL